MEIVKRRRRMIRELSGEGIREESQGRGERAADEYLPLEDLRRGESPFWSLLEWEGQIVGDAAPTFQELPPPRPAEGQVTRGAWPSTEVWLCWLQG